jgi:hypothetical protein
VTYTFEGPDYALRWPADLLVSELDAIARLHNQGSVDRVLLEAFAGESASNVWRDVDRIASQLRPEGFIAAVKQHALAGGFTLAGTRQLRYSERKTGQMSGAPTLTEQQFRSSLARLVGEFERGGYFARQCEFWCPDGDEQKPALSVLVAEELRVANWTMDFDSDQTIDSLLDFIEVLDSLVARPRSWEPHSYGQCPGHPGNFNTGAGQHLYRFRVNALLARTSLGVSLAESGSNQGLLVDVVPGPLAELISPDRWVADTSRTAIEHATGLFQRHGATKEDKKSATVALAGVLEERRPQIKKELTSADENSLFEIANRFGLRHQNAQQHADYREEFLDWIFWWYLATIDLTSKISLNSVS